MKTLSVFLIFLSTYSTGFGYPVFHEYTSIQMLEREVENIEFCKNAGGIKTFAVRYDNDEMYLYYLCNSTDDIHVYQLPLKDRLKYKIKKPLVVSA